MTFGLRTWNEIGGARLDLSDSTMRMTDSIYVGARTITPGVNETQTYTVAGFDPTVDGAVLVFASSPKLDTSNYDLYTDMMPDIEPQAGGILVRWMANTAGYTCTFLDCYLIILRKAW